MTAIKNNRGIVGALTMPGSIAQTLPTVNPRQGLFGRSSTTAHFLAPTSGETAHLWHFELLHREVMSSLRRIGSSIPVDRVAEKECQMPECEGHVDPCGVVPDLPALCPHCGKNVHIQAPTQLRPASAEPPALPQHEAVPILSDLPGQPIGEDAPLAASQPTTSWMAILSLLLALLSIPVCCCTPLSIAAVACGHIGLSDIRRSAGSLCGNDLCIAGLIVGYLTLFLWVVIAIGLGVLSSCGAFQR